MTPRQINCHGNWWNLGGLIETLARHICPTPPATGLSDSCRRMSGSCSWRYQSLRSTVGWTRRSIYHFYGTRWPEESGEELWQKDQAWWDEETLPQSSPCLQLNKMVAPSCSATGLGILLCFWGCRGCFLSEDRSGRRGLASLPI